jgi:pSer/pThr/pTyr-binding forkhead associated (FHA) protein
MADRAGEVRRAPRAPMPRRTRRRWAAAAGVAAYWALLLTRTGSVVGGTVLLLLSVALVAGLVAALRAFGISAAHPWVQRLRSRPWRDGQEILRLALRHLSDLFVITPGGSLLAPNSVELWLNPHDLAALCELMDISLVNASAAEVYAEHVAAAGARLARPGGVEVRVGGDSSVPVGRYRLRQARPLNAPAPFQPVPDFQPVPAGPGPAHISASQAGPGSSPDAAGTQPRRARAGDWPYAHDGNTRGELRSAGTAVTGLPTVTESAHRPVPLLRLVTDGSVTETRVSGARAGRGDVELVLPEVLTVSREHARFTYSDGQWWITNLGRNGLTLNGAQVEGQRPVRDGDSIRWGSKPEAPVSRVRVG